MPELIRTGDLAWTAQQPPLAGGGWDQRYTTWTYGPDGGPGTYQFTLTRSGRSTPTTTYGWSWVIVMPDGQRRDGHLPYEAASDQAFAAVSAAWAEIRARAEEAHAAREAAEAEAAAKAEAEREAARERALLNGWVSWYRRHPGALVPVTAGYWTAYSPDGEETGNVLGGGPTRDTAFKSISLNNVGMNPEVAPGGYARTAEEAAASFMAERGAVPPA